MIPRRLYPVAYIVVTNVLGDSSLYTSLIVFAFN